MKSIRKSMGNHLKSHHPKVTHQVCEFFPFLSVRNATSFLLFHFLFSWLLARVCLLDCFLCYSFLSVARFSGIVCLFLRNFWELLSLCVAAIFPKLSLVIWFCSWYTLWCEFFSLNVMKYVLSFIVFEFLPEKKYRSGISFCTWCDVRVQLYFVPGIPFI